MKAKIFDNASDDDVSSATPCMPALRRALDRSRPNMFAARASAVSHPRVTEGRRPSEVSRARASSCARASTPIGARETRDSCPRRTLGQSLGTATRLVPAFAFLLHAQTDAAHAAGWYNDVPSAGFVGGGGEGFAAEGDAAEYDYGTKDLAVDLASPLVAYKLVSWALNQEIPIWLDAIIIAFTLAAVYVCLFDVDALDDVLV
jgi:hypothetical protein